MSGQKNGYIRISSIGQNVRRQLDGINLDRGFENKVSAKTKKRPILSECLDYVREGDGLHVYSIDRLTRNLIDLRGAVLSICDDKFYCVARV